MAGRRSLGIIDHTTSREGTNSIRQEPDDSVSNSSMQRGRGHRDRTRWIHSSGTTIGSYKNGTRTIASLRPVRAPEDLQPSGQSKIRDTKRRRSRLLTLRSICHPMSWRQLGSSPCFVAPSPSWLRRIGLNKVDVRSLRYLMIMTG